ncbi:MAG: TerB family tellurite resistance protein [Defluviicoccus sp.]|nr:TerB family tellurite resistance protein [Defluviicoccus sp.]MDG4591618.1 TerB family tellurite resistance protein [Defluviicoccus sp.]MDS4012375.1 TerB family tellurite resistance protein [Defluviicoccus sp.]MDS4071968.1 TerB family tellurite resistance protein [Defluviicoccus sp.]
MSIWGKIIGSMAGFAMGGPFGAILGAAAGHAYDALKAPATADWPPRLGGPDTGRATKEMIFSVAVIVLGAKMAKVDGAVSRAEVNAFKQVFRIRPEDMRTVGRIFDAAKSDADGYEPYARQVAVLFRDDRAVLEELLTGLFCVARADGEITRAELSYLRHLAEIFGLAGVDFERLRAPFTQSRATDPYAVLGVAVSASNEEIKKTYRRLIRENHPDALVSKGLPKDFLKVVNERMATINAAYDQIVKERGLK